MLDQDNNFYLISLSILVTCLLDNVQILQGEVACQSLLRIKGLTRSSSTEEGILMENRKYDTEVSRLMCKFTGYNRYVWLM